MADGLIALGGRAVEERDDALTTFLSPPPDPEDFARSAARRLRTHTGDPDLEVSWHWQAHEDWAELWKRGLDVRRITQRIVVHPSWLTPETGPDDVVIQLDPGMAFGTAEHGTTRGCLRLLDALVVPGERVLDVGAGSAILSIAAAHLGAAEVVGVEADPLACEAAAENVGVNGVTDRVSVLERRATVDWLKRLDPVDGLVANLETHLILPLLDGFRACLRPDGWLLLSGILSDERRGVMAAVAATWDVVVDPVLEDRDGMWWTGAFRLP